MWVLALQRSGGGISQEIQLFDLLLLALPAIALLLADQDEPERVVELYALASRFPYVANSYWFEDVAGRYIAAAAVTLSPEVVVAAQERSKARDLLAELEEESQTAEVLKTLYKGDLCKAEAERERRRRAGTKNP